MHLKKWRMKSSHAQLRDGLPFHNLQAQIFLPAALKMMMMMMVIWHVTSHNSRSRHCPLNPEGMQCNGVTNEKRSEAAHITRQSTPLRVLLLFFVETITMPVVEMNRCHHQFLRQFWQQTSSPTWGERSGNVRFWLWHYRWDIQYKADWRTTGWKWNSFAVYSTDKEWCMPGITTYYAFYISQTTTGMELTEWITDCGKYKTDLKL